MPRSLALIPLLLAACAAPGAQMEGGGTFIGGGGDGKSDIIGEDDRTPIGDARSFARAAEATAYITRLSDIDFLDDGSIGLTTRPLGERYDLCPEERFADVDSARGIGTGVMVGPNLMATAGHIFHNGKDAGCYDLAIVFGHTLEAGGVVPAENVYRCERIVSRRLPIGLTGTAAILESGRPDYALVEVAPMEIEDAPPRPWLELGSRVEEGEELGVLGHPFGLPLLVSTPSYVTRSSAQSYYVTDADVSGGNSGGPIVDLDMRLRGILSAELQRSLEPRTDACRTVSRSSADCDDCGTLITRLDPVRSIVERWPDDPGARAESHSVVNLEPGQNVIPLLMEGEGTAAQVFVQAWLYGLDGRSSVRLAHESGCRSPILADERTGSDGYTVIAQTLTNLSDCPIEGEWRLEITSPRAGAALHRWQLTAFDR